MVGPETIKGEFGVKDDPRKEAVDVKKTPQGVRERRRMLEGRALSEAAFEPPTVGSCDGQEAFDL
jgi:hypothetical protein